MGIFFTDILIMSALGLIILGVYLDNMFGYSYQWPYRLAMISAALFLCRFIYLVL